MNTYTQKSTSSLLPPSRGGAVMLRRKKRRLPIRIISFMLIILGLLSVIAVAVGKIADGSIKSMLIGKLSGFLPLEDGTFSPPKTETPTEEDVPVFAPPLSDAPDETSELPEQTTAVRTDTRLPDENPADQKIPSGAIAIVEAEIPSVLPQTENLTSRRFDTEYLEAMKSSVLQAENNGPVCLIIHTHTSESYLPAGTKYYLPSGELARSYDDSENVISVGKALTKTLNDAGINTLHIDAYHDEKGAGTAYVNSANTVTAYLSKYPSIKYVFDIHRSAETTSDGKIIRDSLNVGNTSLARILLTVSGASSLESASVNANLSLALKINSLLCDYASSLSHPVLISDAVYCDGFSPRTLKIDIGSCASTLEEAKESAKILGEAIASLLT